MKAALYLVASPIGNLSDISLRAIQILREVNKIYAEDTRHATKLLTAHGLVTAGRLVSYHKFNESKQCSQILQRIQRGESIALLSDAGTPAISDPGAIVIKAAWDSGLQVVPIPGACAAISAISASGIDGSFTFVGFLPHKSQDKYMQNLAKLNSPLVVYEAPHRLLASLDKLIKHFGANRYAVIARELTKVYENFQRGSLQYLYDYYEQNSDELRGEIVLIIDKPNTVKAKLSAEDKRIYEILLKYLPASRAVEAVAKICGKGKNEVYKLIKNK